MPRSSEPYMEQNMGRITVRLTQSSTFRSLYRRTRSACFSETRRGKRLERELQPLSVPSRRRRGRCNRERTG